jgi:hypothetical protein
VLVTVLLSFTWEGNSQPSLSSDSTRDSLLHFVHKAYGLDQDLINGIQFYERYSHCEGNPYFPSNSFYRGELSLLGERFDHVMMKYDVYAQQLVLEYTDYSLRYNQVIIDGIRIDSFRLGKHVFKKMGLLDRKPLFYQVIRSGPVTLYIHWSKQMTTTSFKSRYTHQLSDHNGEFFLMFREELQPFHHRKSFISLLPDPIRSDMGRYIRQHHITFREPDPEVMEGLVRYMAGKLNSRPPH